MPILRRSLLTVALCCLAGAALAVAPGVATEPAMFVDAYRAQLVGTVTPVGGAVAWFEYGPTKAYGSKTTPTAYATTAQLIIPVENLKEQTLYHFRLVAKTGTATAYGTDATFTTLAAFPADIVAQPAVPYILAKVGQTGVTLDITGTGSSAKYQWLRNNIAIPAAVYESYHLPPLTTNLAGTYTCRVSNPRKTRLSDSVVIAVATINPSATFTANQDGGFSLTAAITPPNPAATFRWFTDQNSSLTGIGTVSGANLPKLTVTRVTGAAADNYKCEIVSKGEMLTPPPVAVAVRLKPVIAPITAQHYQAGQNVALSIPVANSPSLITVTGLPLGLNFDTKLRAIKGRPLTNSVTPYRITFNASNLAGPAAPMSFDMLVDALDGAVKTTFNGLVERQAAVAENGNNGGALKNLVVSATGRYTGTLTIGAATIPVTGQLDTAPGADPSSTQLITRKAPLLDQTLTFTIDRSNAKLSGFVQAAGAAAGAGVSAWGNTYSTAHSSAGLAGLHNFWMRPPAGLAPEGCGFGTATINALGAVALSLRLADGAVVTGTTTIGTTGEVPLHGMLYANHGALHGWLNITDAALPGFNPATGLVTWNKTQASGTNDHSYVPGGFDFGVANNAQSLSIGGGEQRAQTGKILWGLTNVAGQPNARLAFSGGGLASSAFAASVNVSLYLSPLYKATIHGTNLTGEIVSVNGVTGAFNGSFTLYDGTPVVPRKVNFQGLIAPGETKGRGWFTLPEMPATATSSVLSGAVEFSADP